MKLALKTLFLSGFFLILLSAGTRSALAATPVVSASSSGNGSVQLTVNSADSFSRVDLSYKTQDTSLWTTVTNVGMTDQSGYFSQNVNIGSVSTQGMSMYVVINGQQSTTVVVNGSSNPICYGCGSGLSLSPSSLNLNVGQTGTVTVYGANGNFYVSNNSNCSYGSCIGIASTDISGNVINVHGMTVGNASFNVCVYGSNSCANLYVTVGGGTSGQITFSQSSVNLSTGQSSSVSIYGGNYGSYYISNNSNSGVVSASISGSSVSLYAASAGSSTVTVCSSPVVYGYQNSYPSNQCGYLYVTVGGSGGYGQVTFSQSNVSVSVGQSSNVTIYNSYVIPNNNYGSTYQNNYYISSNSNSNSVTASITGNTVYVYGNSSGSATISVCTLSGGNQCGSLYVTVGGGGTDQITFSQSNVSLSVGQSTNVTIYGGSGTYYVPSNVQASAVSASVSGNSLYLYANSNGSATISVCSSNYIYPPTNNYGNQCGSLYVTVGGGYGGQLTFSPSNVSLNSGQSTLVSIYGSSSSGYYVSSNSNSSAVSATITGSLVSLYGYNSGSSTITVCSNYSSQCGSFYVTVSGGTGGTVTFSQNNVSLSLGQNTSVSLYGSYQNSYYISSNSNSGVVSAAIYGTTLSLNASNTGSATITVCASGVSCGSLYVTVGGGTTGSNTVTMSDSAFSPRTITVAAGTTVVWRNNGMMVHTVTSDNNSFNSGNVSPGSTYSFTFNSAGTYNYHCIFHGSAGGGGMSGTVIVTGGVHGITSYANGTLINDNGTIYIAYRNTRTGFANYSAFSGLGFRLSNVIYADSSGLVNSGYVVTTSNAQHPWGSWVKQGNTIYFVHELGLIPISSYDIFLSNGGNSSLVVTANSFDLSLPRLSIMAPNDPRLQ